MKFNSTNVNVGDRFFRKDTIQYYEVDGHIDEIGLVLKEVYPWNSDCESTYKYPAVDWAELNSVYVRGWNGY